MTVQDISWWGFAIIAAILLGFAALVLWKFFSDKGSLYGLILEPAAPDQIGPPKASLSRFQFLIFTFVIAGLYLLLCIESGTFVDIPGNVLALLGISGGTYVISKTVGSSERKQEASAASAARTAAHRVSTTTVEETRRAAPPPGTVT